MIVVNVVDLAVVRGAVCLFVCLSVPIPAARCPCYLIIASNDAVQTSVKPTDRP